MYKLSAVSLNPGIITTKPLIFLAGFLEIYAIFPNDVLINFLFLLGVNTKFKLNSGDLPPGVNLPSGIGGTDLNLNGTVFDSVNVFNKSWAINSNESSNFNKESIFKSKVEFLNLTPSTGLFTGLGLSTKSGHHRIVESVDTYVEDSVTKTKVTVPYVIGTESDPKTLWYSKNTVYDERGVLTKNKDSTFPLFAMTETP